MYTLPRTNTEPEHRPFQRKKSFPTKIFSGAMLVLRRQSMVENIRNYTPLAIPRQLSKAKIVAEFITLWGLLFLPTSFGCISFAYLRWLQKVTASHQPVMACMVEGNLPQHLQDMIFVKIPLNSCCVKKILATKSQRTHPPFQCWGDSHTLITVSMAHL